MKYLYLNLSGFTGKFPWYSIENMTDLVVLSLGDNAFDKSPLPDALFQLTRLSWLYLSNCSVDGKIDPKIGNLTKLINLELSQNYLFGEIPKEITKLSKLWQLELYWNDLTGKIPVGFGNLTVLEKFDASGNNLHGDLSELKSLTQLVSLQLYRNRFSGEIPAEFGELKRLVGFSLYGNHFTGSLPKTLGSWSQFDFIDVSENFLSGPIPPDMCKQGTMTQLLMLQNRFSGDIPANYAACTTLTRFRVSNNSLSGIVPSGIWGLPKVGLFDLAHNQFEGVITSDIAKAESLTQLYLYNNRFSGQLPLEISQATSLTEIDVSNNQFSGEILIKIVDLGLLNKLNLQNNMFSGSIPKNLSSCVALNNINMAHNSFSGTIPASIGSLPVLNSLNLSENKLSGQIPTTLSSLKLNILDLSYNQLSGPIPQSLNVKAYNGSFVGNTGLCSESITGFRKCLPVSDRPPSIYIIVIVIASAAIVFFLSILCVMYLKSKVGKGDERSLKEDYTWDIKSFHVLSFTEDNILDSIKQENLIGKGGSGNVYKVVISDNVELAVKHIWNSNSGDRKSRQSTAPMLSKPTGKLKEFEAEVETLSSIRHVNVVKLYCCITSEDSSLLVYEYLPNGSLYDKLHHGIDKLALDWETRYEIALGAAKGLAYLHHGCDVPIIHRDVKSSNILLDEFFKPRIADFGLAKILQSSADKDSTRVIAGTPGYIAPEYGYTYKVNEKSDVYSFGVVLMELVTGKLPMEPEFGENKNLVGWVSSKLKSKSSILSIMDPTIPEVYREETIKILRIAIQCTASDSTLRPTMRSVVQMIEAAEPCKYLGIVIGKNGSIKQEENEEM